MDIHYEITNWYATDAGVTVLVCVNQLFWKPSGSVRLMRLAAGLAFALGAITMIIAYRFVSLSTLQPVLSFGSAPPRLLRCLPVHRAHLGTDTPTRVYLFCEYICTKKGGVALILVGVIAIPL